MRLKRPIPHVLREGEFFCEFRLDREVKVAKNTNFTSEDERNIFETGDEREKENHFAGTYVHAFKNIHVTENVSHLFPAFNLAAKFLQ